MSSYSKDVCKIRFNEHSHLAGTQKLVLNAFLEGIMCFQFKFFCKDKRGDDRLFEDLVALPKDADEACALEMAEHQFIRWTNKVAELVIEP